MKFKIAFENVTTDDVSTPAVEPVTAVVQEPPAQDTLMEIEQDIQASTTDCAEEELCEQERAVVDAVAIENALNDIADEIEENHRVIEVSESLEDVQAIVSATPDGQTVDIPMLQTAANMAVAGTDADAQSIIPALETFKDKQLAVEAIGEKIALAASSIFESVKNMSDKFVTLVKNVFQSIARLENGLKQREEAIKTVTEKVTFTVKGSRYFQKNETEYVADTADYVKQLGDAVKFFSSWSTAVVKSVAAFDGSVIKFYATMFDREKSKAATKELYDAYVVDFAKSVRTLPGVKVTKDTKEVQSFATPNHLGGVVMQAELPKNIADFETGSRSDIRASIVQTNVRFGRDYLIHDKAAPAIEFTVTPADLKAIIQFDKQLLSSLKQYLNESYKSFKRVSTIAGGAPEKFVIPNSTLLVNRGMNHALFYTGWSRSYGENLLRSTFVVLDKAVKAA